jgi:hypothetical protein
MMQGYGRQLFSTNIISWIVKLAAIVGVMFMPVKEASAANWMYFQRHEGTMFGACTEYMDADSVVKTNKTITYWNILVFDEKQPRNKIKTILFKKKAEMMITPVKSTILEQYFFDITGNEVKHDLKPIVSGWKRTDEVNRALGYAKNAYTSDKPRPNHRSIPQQKWLDYGVYGDSEIYWDANAIVAWPQNKPTTVDVRLKQVWKKAGIEKRKTFLATKEPYSHNDDNDVNYTVLTCQLVIDKSKVRILEITDYDSDNNPITLLDGNDWKDIKQGTLEEIIQSIALSCMKDVQKGKEKK